MRSPLLAAVLALALGGAGCYAHGSATYASPGPQVLVVPEYPGWLWVEGNWYWNGYRHVWIEGYWVEDRPGYVWAPGYYHPHTYVWVAGTWSPYAHDHVYRYPTYRGTDRGRDHRGYHSRGRRGR